MNEQSISCKRLLSLIMAIAMIMTMLPAAVFAAEGDSTVYLVPNANWKNDNARFAVYYWNSAGVNGWTDAVDNGEGYYKATIPAGYTNIIFCRMNPNAAANNWDNKWNQTSDLTVPTDGTNCYTVAEGTWDQGGGTWSTYTPDTVLYLKPNSNWLEAGARFAIYYWNDSGSAWTDMSDTDADGYYEATIPAGISNIIFCRMNPNAAANNWDNKWNQTSDLTVPTDGSNCYTVADGTWDNGGGTWSVYPPETEEEETAKSYYLYGWLNGADVASNELAFVDGKLNITLTATDNYVFVKDSTGANYMTNGWLGFDTTSAVLSTSYATGDKLYVPAGEYEFTLVENADGTVTLSYVSVGDEPEVSEKSYYLYGWLNGADVTANDLAFADGKLELTLTAADNYVFVKDSAGVSYMTDGWLGQGVTTAVLGTSYASGDKLYVPAGEYEFTLVENADGTVTLSYEKQGSEPEPEATYIIAGYAALCGSEWNPSDSANTMTRHTNGLYMKTYENVAKGTYEFKVTDGSWANSWGNGGSNYTFTMDAEGNVTIWFDAATKEITVDKEYTGDLEYTANIHFLKPESWGDTINAWIWDANGAIPGYEQYNTTWPGAPVEADAINAGWYSVSVTVEENTGFSFIFNDGSNQTSDLATGTLNVTTEIWVVNGTVQYTAPAGWIDPSRTVHVPGTFPGPSWDAASNQMTYNPELGLYVYTFEDVPAANYEFKIAINGSWAENYGANGAKDGSNIAVTVPETMDVTVYYNDETHNAVTSVTYKFVEASVSGTCIETTALTDRGLTGIYSGTVSMAAGTYTDVVITCDGVKYAFAEIVLEEGKDVTFYIDPVTGIFYCNASDTPVDADAVYYNSQIETYKAPFGAVEAGEEVRFSIRTGDDVTSAVLVIKGVESIPMTQGEDGLWTATTAIGNIGEYDYYFALSNGSTIAIYGDDDGYYGEGTVTDLVNVMPYDLVVYEAGYKTPDWMKNAVIYQIFPDRFFDGDVTNNQDQTWARGEVNYEYITDWYTLPENPEQEELLDKDTYLSSGAYYGDGEWSNEIYGGDLQGIIQRIDYLKALGVNVIYLNPVFWSISNHRYDAVSYTEIDPILGTLGDFEELVAVAEANDMHIILDGVFNHVSDDSVYFDRYYRFLGESEKIGAYPYWAYVYDYMSENGVDQTAAEAAAKTYFGENYGITDYSYTEWFAVSTTTMAGTVDNVGLRAGKEVYSYEGWWGYDSMPVIYSTNGSEYQTGNWAEEIISGEDSVNAYWISKGMDGWRLDVANEVSDETWQNFRDSVKALDSDAVIIGEIWDDATKYLMGDMYDSVMNYLFRNAVTSYAMGTSAGDTTKAMEKVRERYPEEAFYAMMNLVGSHDTSRLLSYLDGIGDDRSDKSFDAAFPTYEGTSDLAKQRQYLVAFLQFTYAGAPTIYYGDEIGMVGSDDPDDRRAFEWGKGNRELVEWYASLAAIREAYPALRTGSVKPMDLGSNNLLAFTRADDANTVIVIANNAKTAQTCNLEGTYVDLVTGETFTGTVPALSGVILVAEDEVKTITVNTADLAPAYDPAYIVATEGRDHTEHDYEAVVTGPTCTEDGYTTYTCACGDSYVTDYTDALGHAWDEGSVTTEAGCESDGVMTYTCGNCGDTYTEVIPATGHHHVMVESSDPTCELNGYEFYRCEDCGNEYQIILEATGHNYEDGACTVCGAEDPDASKPGSWLDNLFDKIFGSWWGDDEEEETPTDPTVPSEPEEPSEPSEPSDPGKPGWGSIWDWFWKFW